MSDLGEFGSPLPSYPTLPSPPTSVEHHYATISEPRTPPQPAAPWVSPQPTTRPRLASPEELGHHGLNEYSIVDPSWSGYNLTPQQQPHHRSTTDSGLSNLPPTTPDLSSLLDSSHYYSLPPSESEVTPSTSVPIYATVRKPHTSTPSSLPHPSSSQSGSRLRTVSGSPFPTSTASGPVSDLLAVAGQSPPTGAQSASGSTLAAKVQYLEKLCGKLTREKSEMEEGFGRQRKSFMNQMAHSDAQLTLCKHTADKYSREVQELSKLMLVKDEELKNVTIAAGITEATLRERFDADRVKYEEEIASLTKIVSVQSQDTNQAMQAEREAWQIEKNALRAEIEHVKRMGIPVSSPQGVVGRNSPLDQHAKSSSPNSEEADLEISMIKAAEDTKLLRSVVVPLEEEIQSLKARLADTSDKLKETNLRLAEREAASANASLIELSVSDLEASHDDLASPMPSEPRELQNQLRLARAACNDLEMHTSQLNMQKTVLQDEMKSLVDQLTQVSTDLEVEKVNCKELKKTWEMANAHFIVSQDKLKQEIYRLQQKLERGEAVSPLREIDIGTFPAPNIIERPQATGEEKRGELRPSRIHKRSLSTDEAAEVSSLVTPMLERLKSASWSSLHKSTSEETEALSSKAKALEQELLTLKDVLKREKEVSEKQLQRVQTQMVADINEKDALIEKLKIENGKFKAHTMRQRQQYEKLCRQMDDLKEEMRTRIETFQSNEQDLKGQQRILRDKFTELKHDTQREIAKMNEDRRDVYQQFQRSREEYDYLKTIKNSCVTDYQAQIANLKQTCEETTSKLNMTAAQLTSKNDQLSQVREMLLAERSSKEKQSARIASQLEAAKKRIDELSPLVSKLEMEKSAKEDALAAKSQMEQKSRDFINGQREMIEKLNRDKERAENHVQELQRQVASLKHKLNHTEETQKDFVELSQNLQMKLAVMEEEIQKNQELQASLSSPST